MARGYGRRAKGRAYGAVSRSGGPSPYDSSGTGKKSKRSSIKPLNQRGVVKVTK